MAPPLRILHIFGRMDRGGAEMRTLDIMRHIDRQRYQLHFCALSGLPGELDAEIRALGGEVHLMALGPGFSARFRRLLRQQRFDAVHSHIHYSSGFILHLAAQEHIPVRVAHFRTTKIVDKNSLRRRLQRPLLRHWISRHATDILGVSRATLSLVWPNWTHDQRCQIIYNGLNSSMFEDKRDSVGVRREFNLPEDCRLFIHVGRLSAEKNHERLIGIFAELLKRNALSRLLLVGRGGNEVEQRVRTRVRQLGIEGKIIFAGSRADVARLLGSAELLIFPSLWEGLPGAVLEACATGTPVLASDLPGVREIAELLPFVRYLPLEAPDDKWADAAEAILDEKVQRIIGGAGSFASSVFNIEHSVQSYCEVWEGRH